MYIYLSYIYIYIYIYIIYNLTVNARVRLPHPWSGDSQNQETFLAPSADDKQTRNYMVFTTEGFLEVAIESSYRTHDLMFTVHML